MRAPTMASARSTRDRKMAKCRAVEPLAVSASRSVSATVAPTAAGPPACAAEPLRAAEADNENPVAECPAEEEPPFLLLLAFVRYGAGKSAPIAVGLSTRRARIPSSVLSSHTPFLSTAALAVLMCWLNSGRAMPAAARRAAAVMMRSRPRLASAPPLFMSSCVSWRRLPVRMDGVDAAEGSPLASPFPIKNALVHASSAE